MGSQWRTQAFQQPEEAQPELTIAGAPQPGGNQQVPPRARALLKMPPTLLSLAAMSKCLHWRSPMRSLHAPANPEQPPY